MICFPFVGDDIGGSHISAAGLIRRIDPNRFRVLVLLQNVNGAMAAFFRKEGIGFEAAAPSAALAHGQRAGLGQALGLVRGVMPLVHFLRRRGVDLVHSNDGRTHATWALAARLAGARLLWHHRGDPDARGLRFVAPLLADHVVAVSHFAVPRPGIYSAARRTDVVHSPFDTSVHEDRDAARAALIAELGLPANALVIGFFGALIERKRPLLFVDAIAALRARLPGRPVYGLLFGEAFDGAERAIPARVSALGVTDQIRMMGFRAPGTYWLAACDMLLVPAINEPFGRTLIEAMLVGTPVVATASGGNIEAIRHGETGLLAPPDDAEGLADAMARLADDPALMATIAEQAALGARSHFGMARHADAIMAIYDRILSHGPTRSVRGNRHARRPARGIS